MLILIISLEFHPNIEFFLYIFAYIYFQNDGKHDARYRMKDEKYLMVDVKVPQEGQYGLDIFARENWDQQMVHCCKYLINCDVDKYCD